MNPQIPEIALTMVLPLGITFTAILQSVAAYTTKQKVTGVLLSLIIVAMDCVFYFAKNSYISYNVDGGLLLSFASMFILAIIFAIRSEDLATKVGNIFLMVFMLAGFVGTAFWDRPTLLPVAKYKTYEQVMQDDKYQDYIQSFANGTGGKIIPNPKAAKASASTSSNGSSKEAHSQERIKSYVTNAEALIGRMRDITNSIDEFEPLSSNASESEREARSSQALAINNNATALNRKVMGLYHPHSAAEAHSELIQASESVRLAAYSLYNYTLREDPEEQLAQYKQARNQIAQMNAALKRFYNNIENLKSNNQPQQQDAENAN